MILAVSNQSEADLHIRFSLLPSFSGGPATASRNYGPCRG